MARLAHRLPRGRATANHNNKGTERHKATPRKVTDRPKANPVTDRLKDNPVTDRLKDNTRPCRLRSRWSRTGTGMARPLR